ncbi:MAG: SH3 domain-containing protein [Thermoanaerobaculia bacterium]|nr:SH3 domain-containing protein [Thermoanaerobaculia bacterium]
MLKKRLSPPLFLMFWVFVAVSCGNNPHPAKKQAPEGGASKTETPVSPTLASIDTQRPVNPAPATRRPNVPETKLQDYDKLPGPKGFVTRENAILRTEPREKSAEIGKLKKNETIYLLETTMRNEAGELTQYPTWYKIERENKQRGWVVAASIDAGGGG